MNVIHQIYESRGLSVPLLKNLKHPTAWPFVEESARKIVRAIKNSKTLLVWGDYDVDGTTGVALSVMFLREAARKVHSKSRIDWHVPCRFAEGYGLNKEFVAKYARNYDLMITVDCGSNNPAEIALARASGMDVVVTDHHLPAPGGEGCNPALLPDRKGMALCGAGMAWMLMAQVNAVLGRPVDMKRFLPLVAMASVADMVELTGQNRILTAHGLAMMQHDTFPGLDALKGVAGIHDAVTTESVSFGLAPRINAVGRLAHARMTVELFLTQNPEEAARYARRADALNLERKKIEDRMVSDAIFQAEQLLEKYPDSLVVHGRYWAPGVAGIVASRLVERFHVPALVACESGLVKGSARSLASVNVYAAMSQCSVFERFGGHAMAAGFALQEQNLDRLRQEFNAAVNAVYSPVETVEYDAFFEPVFVDRDFVENLKILEPCGAGNPAPVFQSNPLTVAGVEDRSGMVVMDLLDDSQGVMFRGRAWRPQHVPELGNIVEVYYTPKTVFGDIELDIRNWKSRMPKHHRHAT